MSAKTVETHRRSITRKLGLTSIAATGRNCGVLLSNPTAHAAAGSTKS